jgi:hypothetical protein
MSPLFVVPLFLSLVLIDACESATSAPNPPTQQGRTDAAVRPAAQDPSRFRATSSLMTARFGHTATLLADGRVLIIGGENLARRMMASVEIFDPATESWTAGPNLPEPRSNHAAMRLDDGRVLVVGGGKSSPNGQPLGEGVLASSVLYDPASNTFSATGSVLEARSHFQIAGIPGGKVMVVGGGSAVQESPGSCGSSPASKRMTLAPASGRWRPRWEPGAIPFRLHDSNPEISWSPAD